MQAFPEVEMDCSELYRITGGSIQTMLLMTGIELKVFNHLNEPRSSNYVAEVLGTHRENTRLFLDGLSASNLIVKKKGTYQNTAVVGASLVEKSPTYIGEMLYLMAQMRKKAISDLSELVKKGPAPSNELNLDSEETWEQYALSMANYQRAGVAGQAMKIVSQLPGFSSFDHMLDLGGGPGLVGIHIVSSHPTMEGVIFDQPAVIKVAETFIKEYKMEGRMTVLGGDYNQDAIGNGYDLIWASATLNFARHHLDTVIKKIYDALKPGGFFVSVADGLTSERTQPESYVLDFLPSALMGRDMAMNQGEIADSMIRAGFRSVRSRTIDTPMMPMELDIARKGE